MKKAFLLTLLTFFTLCIFSSPVYALADGDYEFEIIPGTQNCKITKYVGSSADVVIPHTLTDNGTDYTVTVIGANSFNHNTGIESVFIPNSVVEIDEAAFGYTFQYRGSIETVIFEEGSLLDTIDKRAFRYNNITDLTIPGNVKTLGYESFYGNPISSLVLAEGLEYIGEASFDYHMLTSLHIPASVTYIGEGAFIGSMYDFDNYPLTSVTFAPGSNLEIIDYQAFMNNSISEIELPDTLTEIGEQAFENNNIKNLTIPGSVKVIGDYAFRDNDLTTLILEEGIEEIGRDAFVDHYISELIIPASVTNIQSGAFTGPANPDSRGHTLSKLTFAKGSRLKSIGISAFAYNNISSLKIPNSVIYIGVKAFNHNNISYAQIPESVTYIGRQLFYNNPMLEFQLPFHNYYGCSGYWRTVSSVNYAEGSMIPTDFNKDFELVVSNDAYKVTLDNQGVAGNTVFFISYGNYLPSVSKPEAYAHRFIGYYTHPNGQGIQYYSEDMFTDKSWDIQSDTTLYAYWIPFTFLIYFDSQGGSEVSYQYVNYGEYVKEPAVPIKNSFAFRGWYTRKAFLDDYAWDFANDSVSSDMTFYAKWEDISVTEISLSASDITLRENETSKLTAGLTPSDSNKRIFWVSSDNSVATVSQSGVVYGEGKGTCVITASSMGYLATCTVEVKPKHVSSVMLTPSSYTMYVGQMVAINADIYPSNASYRSTTWKSSDNDVATVTDEGIVEAYGAGTCTITATADGVSDTCKITVPNAPLSETALSLSLDKNSITVLYVGDTVNVVVNGSSFGVQKPPVIWKSSNESVATVYSDGKRLSDRRRRCHDICIFGRAKRHIQHKGDRP